MSAGIQPGAQRMRGLDIHGRWSVGHRPGQQRTGKVTPHRQRSAPELGSSNAARTCSRSSSLDPTTAVARSCHLLQAEIADEGTGDLAVVQPQPVTDVSAPVAGESDALAARRRQRRRRDRHPAPHELDRAHVRSVARARPGDAWRGPRQRRCRQDAAAGAGRATRQQDPTASAGLPHRRRPPCLPSHRPAPRSPSSAGGRTPGPPPGAPLRHDGRSTVPSRTWWPVASAIAASRSRLPAICSSPAIVSRSACARGGGSHPRAASAAGEGNQSGNRSSPAMRAAKRAAARGDLPRIRASVPLWL